MNAKATTLAELMLISGISNIHSQSFSLGWFTIDSGGGMSSGGNYSLSGTIGQPDAGVTSGGSFALVGGFWGAYAVSTPEAPTLFIRLDGPNAIISWEPQSEGFVLQTSPALSPSTWTDALSGNANPVSVPANSGIRFYRLRIA